MSAVTWDNARKWTVDEVLRMVDAGILREDEHLELLDGVLIERSPQGPPHAGVVSIIAEALRAAYAGAGVAVREEKPLYADGFSLPEPDVAVVIGRHRDYAERHPRGSDTWLVVEVAHSSQRVDRQKGALYARAAAPVYWLVDLVARRVLVHREPATEGYGIVEIASVGDALEVPGAGARLQVADVLP